jgi:hypothetical protein
MSTVCVKKGQTHECPEGCGAQGIKQVESSHWPEGMQDAIFGPLV